MVCASTFDAGLTANFNIALESSEDAAATLTALPASPDARLAHPARAARRVRCRLPARTLPPCPVCVAGPPRAP